MKDLFGTHLHDPVPRPRAKPGAPCGLRHERQSVADGAILVCGVDEAGRGPLAGPVTAAAVILPARGIPRGLNDSKKLNVAEREKLAARIMACADWAVAHASVAEIDDLNIYHAAHLAMCRAVAALRQRPCVALIDGNRLPRELPVAGRAIIGGDAQCASIAAASILAKVTRDRLMVDLAQQHPGYGWEMNAGYPTPAHKQALQELGPTPIHRRDFAPVHQILCKDLSTSA
ncbi:ribonuclease HII [Paracoccus sp. Z118]|uniref:ribonuclease HII n=1 Tax=Paracoccus sp. Z118 TaxID=2851017 RepID=UPI001C2C9802|nr:ribonuclease HII [Paracoccus sp. Z118]MBV0891797.1 ribonuclease HII [Paracoccus sp. Z118]